MTGLAENWGGFDGGIAVAPLEGACARELVPARLKALLLRRGPARGPGHIPSTSRPGKRGPSALRTPASATMSPSALNDELRCVSSQVHAHAAQHSACGGYPCPSAYTTRQARVANARAQLGARIVCA